MTLAVHLSFVFLFWTEVLGSLLEVLLTFEPSLETKDDKTSVYSVCQQGRNWWPAKIVFRTTNSVSTTRVKEAKDSPRAELNYRPHHY